MKSKIFDCVDNDDVEELKVLMHYPNLFQIEDDSGYTILQRAILNKRIAVAHFLLSQDDCPINACNTTGETALEVALSTDPDKWKEHYVYFLLKKGADIHCSRTNISLLLHNALEHNHIKVAKFLIEKGADLNCQNYLGQTPLHMLLKLSRRNNRNELLAMMLYFGADLAIPDCDNYKPIDFVFLNGVFSESMQEHVLFNFFDDYCTGYEIPIDILFRLIQSKSPFAPQVLKHITSVYVDKSSIGRNIGEYFIKLFIIKTEYLKLLLEKFEYVIQYIIHFSLNIGSLGRIDIFLGNVLIENLDLMLQSHFSSDIIRIINKTKMYDCMVRTIPELSDLMLVLLSYGANISNDEIENVYKVTGDCEFFRILLHMDIKISDENEYDIMPALLYNINMDIETFMSNPDKFKSSLIHSTSLEELFSYFAHPKLKNFCRSVLRRQSIINEYWYNITWAVFNKIGNLPSVPLLVELARNEVRKFLIRKYNIKNSMQFYTLVKHLPISKVHEKIITLETKLY